MGEKIRLMLVDDHEVVRAGLRSLLSMFPHIEIVAEASNADSCLKWVTGDNLDVILMDIKLPGKNGIEACREIKQVFPSVQIVMLTSYESKEFVLGALEAGASGYVLKEIGAQGLIRSIESVFVGEKMLDKTIVDKLVDEGKETAENEKLLEDLTDQEKLVLQHLSYGKTNREIAELMMLREKTVRNYVSLILEKLNLQNRTEAASFVFRHHLIR